MEQTEDFVRENPTRAMAYAVLAGLVIDRLPVFRILGWPDAAFADGAKAGRPDLRRDEALPGDEAGRGVA